MALLDQDGNALDPAEVQAFDKSTHEATFGPGFDTEPVGLDAVFGAAFRQENIIGSALANKALMSPFGASDIEEGYNPFDDIKGSKYEAHADKFVGVMNSEYASLLKETIDQEEEDRQNLHAAGPLLAMTAGAAAGTLDVSLLIPGFAAVKAARGAAAVYGGLSVSQTAMASAGLGAGAMTLTEAGLHATQNLRTMEESATNIAFGTLVTGALGAAVARSMNKGALDALTTKFAKEVNEDPSTKLTMDDVDGAMNDMRTQSLSAGEVPIEYSADELTFRGDLAKNLAKTSFFNPMVGLIASPFAASRRIAAMLPEVGFNLKMVETGKSMPQSVESRTRELMFGQSTVAIKKIDAAYAEHRKNGGTLSNEEFAERVGMANNRGDRDEGGDKYIEQAALGSRSMYEYFFDQANSAGALPRGIQKTESRSYAPRLYSRDKILADEPGLRKALRDHFTRSMPGDEATARRYRFVDDADRQDYIDEMVQTTVNHMLGHGDNFDFGVLGRVANRRGPLKERTLRVPYDLLAPYLDNNVYRQIKHYTRLASPNIELTRAFGRADMEDQFRELHDDYIALRNRINADKTLDKKKKTRLINKARKQYEKDEKNIEGIRNRVLGVRYLDERMSTGGLATSTAMSLMTYVRMGGVTLSSLSDIGRNIMIHGLRRTFDQGLTPFLDGLKATKPALHELQLAGVAVEPVFNTRHMAAIGMDDMYELRHPINKIREWGDSLFSKASGILYWNQLMKQIAGNMSQTRILESLIQAHKKGFDSLTPREQEYMAFLGLGSGDAERVGKFAAKYATKEGKLLVANSEKWAGTTTEPIAHPDHRLLDFEVQNDGTIHMYTGTRKAAPEDTGKITLYRGEGPTDPNRRQNRPYEWYTTDLENAKSYASAAGSRGLLKVEVTPEELAKMRTGLTEAEIAVPKDVHARSVKFDEKPERVFFSDAPDPAEFSDINVVRVPPERVRDIEPRSLTPEGEAMPDTDFRLPADLADTAVPRAAVQQDLATAAEGTNAARMFRAALGKDVDSIIVTKGAGDTPLFADSNVGRLLMQFKTFMLASHNRVLMRAASSGPDERLRTLMGITTMTGLGMLVYMIKEMEKNGGSTESITNNPGKFLAEGLDRAGVAGALFEYNNLFERLAGVGVYTGAQAMFPGLDQSPPASRWAQRNTLGAMMGPSFGYINDAVASSIALRRWMFENAEMSEGDVRRAKRMAPGYSLPYMRFLFSAMED